MKVCVLASGSSGNCIFVGTDRARVLIDGGLSARETVRRLELIGEQPQALQGICLTHEHGDHTIGLKALQKRFNLPLFANAGTIAALEQDLKMRGLAWQVFSTGAEFTVGDLRITPFAVSHDAFEPVGFVIASSAARLGVVTDIGVCTHLVRERLRGCQALIIESNHDERLLADARRPWRLKQRIAGRQGHLSNQHAAQLIAEIAGPELRHIFLSHLSLDCNRPELALHTAKTALLQRGLADIIVSVTYPDRISEVWARHQGNG